MVMVGTTSDYFAKLLRSMQTLGPSCQIPPRAKLSSTPENTYKSKTGHGSVYLYPHLSKKSSRSTAPHCILLQESMTSETLGSEDSENFWKVAAEDSAFWDAYVSTRPNYSQSFYELIYNHHSAHSSTFAVAHDVGCGAGQVAAELASRFSYIVASDESESHLDVARRRVGVECGASRVSYLHAKGEDLANHHQPGTADLIATAEAMPLMDADEGLRSFASLLKPGGTLACWFYGRPTFSESIYYAKGQRILDAIMVLSFTKVLHDSGPARIKGLKRAAEGMDSWLDNVRFPLETWTDVQRHKWNTHGTLPFFGKEALGFEIEPVSNVTKREKVIVNEDPEFWRNSWDIASLKEYFRVLFPGFQNNIANGDLKLEELYKELDAVMGGEGVIRQFTWPCVLVMATRR